MKSNRTFILGASLMVTILGVTCKLLGFIREMSIAGVFGASSDVDSYVMALSIPSVLIATIASAIGTVVVPQFIRMTVVDGKKTALAMVENIWSVLLVCTLAVVLLCEAGMPVIMNIIAPGFKGAVLEETVYLARILMPTALFLCLLPIAKGVLNSLQKYTLTATADMIPNVIIITSIYLLTRYYGITGLAAGTLLGWTTQMIILWLALRRYGFRPGIRINWKMPELRKTIKLAIPVTVGSGLVSINLFINRMIASGLSTGTVASLNYANLIYTMPLVFVTPAVSTVFYTVLADFAARNDVKRVIYSVNKGLSLFAYIGFPIAGGMYLLSLPMVQIIYQRGAFQADAAQLTAAILAMYVLGIPAIGMREICSRAFYTEGDTITPLCTGLVAIAVSIIFIMILVRFLAAPGLALATTIGSWAGTIMLMWLWQKKHKAAGTQIDFGPYGRPFWAEMAKILVSTVIMSFVVDGVWNSLFSGRLAAAVSKVRPGSFMFTMIELEYFALAVLLGITTYVLCTSLLKSENKSFLWSTCRPLAVKFGGIFHKG